MPQSMVKAASECNRSGVAADGDEELSGYLGADAVERDQPWVDLLSTRV